MPDRASTDRCGCRGRANRGRVDRILASPPGTGAAGGLVTAHAGHALAGPLRQALPQKKEPAEAGPLTPSGRSLAEAFLHEGLALVALLAGRFLVAGLHLVLLG